MKQVVQHPTLGEGTPQPDKNQTGQDRTYYPGAELWGWLPLAGLALMVLNDHFLRIHWPGMITGKLSDVGVVLFFPFLLTATLGWLQIPIYALKNRLLGKPEPMQIRFTKFKLIVAIASTAFALGSINLSYQARDLYLRLLGLMDIFNLFSGFRYTVDPTDCFALLLLPLTWWWAMRQELIYT